MGANHRRSIFKHMDPHERIETKICSVCAENIPAAAKICPRCRQWLSFRSFRHPLVSALFGGMFMLGLLILLFRVAGRVQELINPPPYYAEFRNSLQILHSNMNWVETSDGPRLFLTGTLTNQSEIAWRSPEFECRFFDSSGRMVDAANGSTFLTVMPGADSAFRVSVKPGLSSNDYSAFSISISNARNGRSPF